MALLGEKPTESGQIVQNGVNKEPSRCLPDNSDGVRPSKHPSLHCPHPVDDFRFLNDQGCLSALRFIQTLQKYIEREIPSSVYDNSLT